jgi:hypothetical protein
VRIEWGYFIGIFHSYNGDIDIIYEWTVDRELSCCHEKQCKKSRLFDGDNDG